MNKKKPTAAPEPRKRGRRPVADVSAPQRRAFTAIRNHLAQRGFPPTVQELGELLGLGASSAHELVNQLVRKGYLRRDAGKARSLEFARQFEPGVADLAVPIADGLAIPRGTAVMTTSRKNEGPRMTKRPRKKDTRVPREKASAVSRPALLQGVLPRVRQPLSRDSPHPKWRISSCPCNRIEGRRTKDSPHRKWRFAGSRGRHWSADAPGRVLAVAWLVALPPAHEGRAPGGAAILRDRGRAS